MEAFVQVAQTVQWPCCENSQRIHKWINMFGEQQRRQASPTPAAIVFAGRDRFTGHEVRKGENPECSQTGKQIQHSQANKHKAKQAQNGVWE